jgi:hypothetical protein
LDFSDKFSRAGKKQSPREKGPGSNNADTPKIGPEAEVLRACPGDVETAGHRLDTTTMPHPRWIIARNSALNAQ